MGFERGNPCLSVVVFVRATEDGKVRGVFLGAQDECAL
jgi:hypothetical protein